MVRLLPMSRGLTCLGSALAFGRWRNVEFEAAERLLAHFMGFLKRWVAV